MVGEYGRTGVRIDDLRITFNVVKSMKSSANEASVTVYNMSQKSRELLEGESVAVKLMAGYSDATEVIFDGQMVNSKSYRARPNWITEIEAADGVLPMSTGKLATTFATGTPRSVVVKKLVAAMNGIALGTTDTDALRRALSSPLVVSGSARRSLDTLARQWGFWWSIQDGTAEIRDKGKRGRYWRTAPLVSPETGLIGAPERTEDGLEIRSLLNPQIRPGAPLQLDSEFERGLFQPEKVTMTGDTHGQDWTSMAVLIEAG